MITILGRGQTGQSLAEFFHSQSIEHQVFDESEQSFASLNLQFDKGDELYLSPGIDPRKEPVRSWLAFEKKELALFRENFCGQIIGVTGTNGKSSFVFNLGRQWKKIFGDDEVLVGGNIGKPMMTALQESPKARWAILELSSYQLERCRGNLLDWGVLLNLAPDHQKRYDSLEDYYRAKWTLCEISQKMAYPLEYAPPADCRRPSDLDWNEKEEAESLLDRFCQKVTGHSSPLPWQALPHRLEILGEDPQGWTWINDSKATNLESTRYALRKLQASFAEICLLVGGQDKGEDFSILKQDLRSSDRLLSFGESAPLRAQQLCLEPSQVFSSLEALLAKRTAPPVQKPAAWVLSPGGASFDEFQNFEERGAFFSTFWRELCRIS